METSKVVLSYGVYDERDRLLGIISNGMMMGDADDFFYVALARGLLLSHPRHTEAEFQHIVRRVLEERWSTMDLAQKALVTFWEAVGTPEGAEWSPPKPLGTGEEAAEDEGGIPDAFLNESFDFRDFFEEDE